MIEFRTVFGDVPPLTFDEASSSFEGTVETRSVATHGELAVLRATDGQYASCRPGHEGTSSVCRTRVL